MKVYLVVYRYNKEVKTVLTKQHDGEIAKKYVEEYCAMNGGRLTVLLVTPFDDLVRTRLDIA